MHCDSNLRTGSCAFRAPPALAVNATEPIRLSQTVHASVPLNSVELVVLSTVLFACNLAQETHPGEEERAATRSLLCSALRKATVCREPVLFRVREISICAVRADNFALLECTNGGRTLAQLRGLREAAEHYMRSARIAEGSDGRGATLRSFREFRPDPPLLTLVAREVLATPAEICPAEMTLALASDCVDPRRGGEPISGGGCSGMRSDRRWPVDFTAALLRRFGERVGVPLLRVWPLLPGDAAASGAWRGTAREPDTEPSGKSAGGAGLAFPRVGLPSGNCAGGPGRCAAA